MKGIGRVWVWRGMLKLLIEGFECKNEEFKFCFVESEVLVKGFWVRVEGWRWGYFNEFDNFYVKREVEMYILIKMLL